MPVSAGKYLAAPAAPLSEKFLTMNISSQK
jgi:hypothetical protein